MFSLCFIVTLAKKMTNTSTPPIQQSKNISFSQSVSYSSFQNPYIFKDLHMPI